MDPRTPNLFIVGAPKAGTTFVHHALALDPSVYMSPVKEPGFFSSSKDQELGFEYYLRAYFSKAAGHRYRGESTPWYLYSDVAPERIARAVGTADPRFVVLVRRPSSRALSMYRDRVRINLESRSFEQAIESELEHLADGVLDPDVRRRYVWCGQYVDHIERWRATFGGANVHIAVFEDLSSGAEAEWAELSSFLDDGLGPSRFGEVSERDKNRGGSLRWPRIDRFLRMLQERESPVVQAVKRHQPPGLHRRILQQVGRLNRSRPDPFVPRPAAVVTERLDGYCRADTERLEKLLGRHLTAWSDEPSPEPDHHRS